MEIKFSLSEIDAVASQVLNRFEDKKCFAFFATMGSGKTTLIHALCKNLKSIDAVSSPTFSIINEYKTEDNKSIYHMDWYRLKGEEDAIEAGVEDILKSNDGYCFIEWPEIALGLLPKNTIQISIETLNETMRKITFKE